MSINSSCGPVQALLVCIWCCATLTGCDRLAPPSTTASNTSAAEAEPASLGEPWFEEVALQRGVNFTWNSGHGDRYLFPECVGGGAALFDMDNDGDLDIYMVQGGDLRDPSVKTANVLLRNRGDGFFDDVTASSGDAAAVGSAGGYGMGVAAGDYDNDGDLDLYVTNVGPNQLLRNNADGTFTNVTATAGVGHAGWGTSAAFLDYDRDGDLDIFACNYIDWSIGHEQDCFNTMGAKDYCDPNNYSAPAMDVLYRNEGNGRFTDVTLQAGLDAYYGNGLGVVCGDYNDDGWIDIFVANDGMRNQLWVNRRDGTFVDLGLQTGCALDMEGKAKAGMGTHAVDIDDDGDLDIMVCNLTRESDSLFINEKTHFSDETTRAGLRVITRAFTRFGMGLMDFDNDGDLDLYEANGTVMRDGQVFVKDDPYAQPNLLFSGRSGASAGIFDELKPRGGTAELLVATSRAAVFGDIDNDGGVDVLVINRDSPAHLLRNRVAGAAGHGRPNHWIMLRVLDEHGRDAYGAVVKFRAGPRTITRDVRAAYSYLASNDPRVHAGLGELDHVESVVVRWNDGAIETFGNLAADKVHTLKRTVRKP